MEIEAYVVQRVSKAGSPYMALQIKFPGGYEKLVMLEKSEQALLKILLDGEID